MKVETYEQIETTNETETMAHDAASLELIERLGLAGQKQLSNPKTLTRCPYRQMTKDEHFVYSQICPAKSEPAKYAGGPIPLRVLQIIAWAQDNPIFKRLEIWASTSAVLKDPVLVAYLTDPEYTWKENIFLLARWGDELLPIDVLMPDAYKSWWTKQNRQAIQDKKQAELKLAELESVKDFAHIPESF